VKQWSKVEELIAMKWGVHGETLICTGEQGEGVIMADTEAGMLLTKEEAAEVARHIVRIHNAGIEFPERSGGKLQ
jgi:hypothetical protein